MEVEINESLIRFLTSYNMKGKGYGLRNTMRLFDCWSFCELSENSFKSSGVLKYNSKIFATILQNTVPLITSMWLSMCIYFSMLPNM